MPPQISDDERSVSDVSEEQQEEQEDVKGKGKGKAKADPEEELKVESEEEDDEEPGEDEYAVEAIKNHAIDEDGKLQFHVKWEGYEKKADMTWEPEENLETAGSILSDYLAKVGGKDFLFEQYHKKKEEAAVKKEEAAAKRAVAGKKRGRPSQTTPQSNGKKSRKNGSHPLSQSPPASLDSAQFKPPSGSWEEEVTSIEAMEATDGAVVVYLTWKGGHKSQHQLQHVYKRCPQKMLKFYESHLVFKKAESDE